MSDPGAFRQRKSRRKSKKEKHWLERALGKNIYSVLEGNWKEISAFVVVISLILIFLTRFVVFTPS